MQKQNAKELLEKYKAGLGTEKEKAMVENWYLTMPSNEEYPTPAQIERSKKEVWTLLARRKDKSFKLQYLKFISAAAAVLICLGAGFYLSSFFRRPVNANNQLALYDIAPGGNKATLILANGKRIILDGASNGKIAEESGIAITKTADGQLIYKITKPQSINPTAFNTIVTPRGGQYQVALPDGSRVWLNAASSLKFPASFGSEERRVELNGEAYFEVAKNAKLPFKVLTVQQEVEVMGTHFNINSYLDEANTKTTLFEGSVKVFSKMAMITKVLKPGQQAVVEEKNIGVSTVDTDESLAWKNGLFVFNNESLESIMRRVSRWYNVSIEYQDDEVRKEAFGGSVSRFGNVSEILRMLEITGNVHFKIYADKIIVMKK